MPGRATHPDARDSSAAMVYCGFSVLTNGSSNPIITTSATGTNLRGEGLLPTGSVVHSATGKYTVTMDVNYTCRYITRKWADLEANAAGDGAYATIAAPSQGEGDGKALTFVVFTHNAGGTLTDFTGRRLVVELDLKCGAEGF